MNRGFPLYTQHDAMDCGPTCLRMVAAYYGQHYSAEFLRKHCFISRQGVSLLGISEAAEQLGMHTIGVQLPLERLVKDVSLPCIIHWNQNHFVVLYQVRKSRKGKTTFYVADPAGSLLTYTEEEFKRCWLSNRKAGTDEGIVPFVWNLRLLSIKSKMNWKNAAQGMRKGACCFSSNT